LKNFLGKGIQKEMNSSAGRTEVSGLQDFLGPLIQEEDVLAVRLSSRFLFFLEEKRQENRSSGKALLSPLLPVDKGELFHIIYRLPGEAINNLLPEACLISKNLWAHYP
jgi:hypothetical protein